MIFYPEQYVAFSAECGSPASRLLQINSYAPRRPAAIIGCMLGATLPDCGLARGSLCFSAESYCLYEGRRYTGSRPAIVAAGPSIYVTNIVAGHPCYAGSTPRSGAPLLCGEATGAYHIMSPNRCIIEIGDVSRTFRTRYRLRKVLVANADASRFLVWVGASPRCYIVNELDRTVAILPDSLWDVEWQDGCINYIIPSIPHAVSSVAIDWHVKNQ